MADDPSDLDRARGALARGALDDALALLETALGSARKRADRAFEAAALVELSRALRTQGKLDRAFVHAEQAGEAARAARLPALEAEARLVEADLLRAFEESVGAARKAREAASLLEGAAREARQAGDLERACAHFERAREARELMGDAPPRPKDEARRREEGLVLALYETSRRIIEERDPEQVLLRVLEAAVQATRAERGFVLLAGDGEGELDGLSVAAARDFDRSEIKKPEFKVSRGAIEKALATRRPLLVKDAATDPDLSGRPSVAGRGLRSLVCVPFEMRSVRGVLYLDNRFAEGAFAESDLPALEAFAAHAACAVESARFHADTVRKTDELEAARKRAEELAARLEAELTRTDEELARVRVEKQTLRAGLGEIVGSSHAMQEVYRLLEKVKQADIPVLVRGESGTGKELVARAIHFEGSRRKAPFVSESCAALPETLLESALFGHEAGAFTGALVGRAGLFELARDGTLFLDEVGELSPGSQAKLLRVLQERVVRRLGGDRELPVKARIVAATNRDLEAMVREGAFREDLYYRLNVVTVRVPSLRERREDVPEIVRSLSKLSFSPSAMRTLCEHVWPGNVRELANELRRLEAIGLREVNKDDLLLSGKAPRSVGEAPRTLRDIERAALVDALRQTGGNKALAADLLAIPRGSLWHKMRHYKINDEECRDGPP